MKKTKIVATIGPSSWTPEVMEKMIKAGMNVARLNGAFADVPEMERIGKIVRAVSPNTALLLDIKGHEVRLNRFSENIHVNPGDLFVLGSSESDPVYPITYPELYQDLEPGQTLIVDKGATTMKVEKIEDGKIYCRIINGSVIASGKGMNTPGAKLNNPPITKRDIEQIKFAVQDNWDFVAASFVRNAHDIEIVKEQTGDSNIQIIAKIEDQQGVDNIDEILKVADGIMIARGDMGTEMPFERLPMIQKELIYKCNKAAKPVITATNMLESMTENIMPSRAEITDVANAVLDGTDAIMTSAETTSGKYPIEAMETMTRIALETEKYLVSEILDAENLEGSSVHTAITNAAFEFVMQLPDIKKIIVYTHKGLTARLLARHNLPIEVIALVKNENIKNQLHLTKGVTAKVFHKDFSDRDEAVKEMIAFAKEEGLIDLDDKILLIGNCNYVANKEIEFPNLFEYIEIKRFLDK